MVNTKVTLSGWTLDNPVIPASGTFNFGKEFAEFYDINMLGTFSFKGTTRVGQFGNPTPRIAETPMGMINSVGLQNPGVDHFIEKDLPWLKQQDTVVIANIAGNTEDDYCAMAEKLSNSDVDMIEMNISCPNVKGGGMAFGTDPEVASTLVKEVKKVLKMVKRKTLQFLCIWSLH